MRNNYVRDYRARTLASWTMRRSSQSDGPSETANTGFELAGRDVPKYKFLYTVSFEFGDRLMADMRNDGGGWLPDMASNVFPCKTATRPNINISYTDVNSYNYRYKVATKTDYGTTSLTIYDDNKNSVHNLVTNYLATVSPVSIRPAGDSYYLRDAIQEFASLGPLPIDEADGLIRTMRVRHYVNRNNNDDPNDRKWISYDYVNPKIQSISLDELDMSASDVSTISLTFVYDSVHMYDNYSNRSHTGTVTIGEMVDPETGRRIY